MNLLNGIVSMGCAFWMIIYLYGLKAVSSPKYHYDLFVMPTVLIVISLFCFYFALKDPILKIVGKQKMNYFIGSHLAAFSFQQIMARVCSRHPFAPAGAHPFHNVALEQEEDDEHRNQGDDGHRKHRAPIRHGLIRKEHV